MACPLCSAKWREKLALARGRQGSWGCTCTLYPRRCTLRLFVGSKDSASAKIVEFRFARFRSGARCLLSATYACSLNSSLCWASRDIFRAYLLGIFALFDSLDVSVGVTHSSHHIVRAELPNRSANGFLSQLRGSKRSNSIISGFLFSFLSMFPSNDC